jgi:preprotein translocase subunit SecD
MTGQTAIRWNFHLVAVFLCCITRKGNVLEILFILLAIVLIVLGVAGTLFPALPACR